MPSTEPRVSCLCLASGQLPSIKECIRSFCEQTYSNRELLLGIPQNDSRREHLRRYVQGLAADVVLVETAAESIADLVPAAAGTLCCAWQTSDSHHPRRIEVQAANMRRQNSPGCILGDWLVFGPSHLRLFWIEPNRTKCSSLSAATLLSGTNVFQECWKQIHQERLSHGFRDIASLSHGAALVVSHVEHDDMVGALEACCKTAEFVRNNRGLLRATLPAHRLARPYLIHARHEDGTIVSMDPFDETSE